MMKLKFLYEDFDMARECLKMYDYDKESLDSMLSYFRVSSNAVYPFRKAGGKGVCFLRMSPAEEKEYKDVETEVRLICWLLKRNIPVMKPYPMRDGKLSKQIRIKDELINVSCFEAVPGKPLDDIDGDAEIAYGYGKLLGKLHKNLKDYPFAYERRDHTDLLDEVRKRFIRYHAQDKMMEEFRRVVILLDQLSVTRDTYGIVHYDFEPDNVLFDRDTGSFGIIDFDDSIRCWYALDIVRALDAMNDVVKEDQIEEAKKRFIEGYKEECLLSEEQEASILLMRRLVQLQSYGTILYVLSEDADDKPDWMMEIIDKLKIQLRKIECNVSA
ncbi:MAG: hypothetical protein CW338_02860 [Clostridiales bacterium]|nr:hypothetical protein [Clostridiales bacterium]